MGSLAPIRTRFCRKLRQKSRRSPWVAAERGPHGTLARQPAGIVLAFGAAVIGAVAAQGAAAWSAARGIPLAA